MNRSDEKKTGVSTGVAGDTDEAEIYRRYTGDTPYRDMIHEQPTPKAQGWNRGGLAETAANPIFNMEIPTILSEGVSDCHSPPHECQICLI